MADATDGPSRPRASVPDPDPKLAEKGASTPAPIPPEDMPDREKDAEKARAILDGRDPAVAELVDELKDSGGLIEVAKGGKTLEVHPATLDAHLSVGWRIVDADRADAAKARAVEPDAGPFVHPPRAEPKPSRPAGRPKSK